ncbi:MAG: hypothetical protein ABF384_11425 [Verrucomicrobiales bacterium]
MQEFRVIGERPILVSSVTRRDFTGEGKIRIDQPGPDATGARATRPLKPWADAIAGLVIAGVKEGVPELAKALRK